MNTTLKSKDLPCLFENLVERYQNTFLVQCETKEIRNGILHQEKNQLKEQNFWLSIIFINYLENYSI